MVNGTPGAFLIFQINGIKTLTERLNKTKKNKEQRSMKKVLQGLVKKKKYFRKDRFYSKIKRCFSGRIKITFKTKYVFSTKRQDCYYLRMTMTGFFVFYCVQSSLLHFVLLSFSIIRMIIAI